MTRPIRNRDPSLYRLITIRTVGAELWLAPTGKVRRLLGGIVARYQEIFGIELYAYCFLGNHPHLLIKAPKENTDEFCENVNREIARRINWKYRREGKLWARRYDDQKVLSEEDLLAAFLYVTTNPTKHGLVKDSSQWPGLNSFKHCLTEQDRTFKFNHYSALDEKLRVTTHKLKLSILPQFNDLSKAERTKKLKELLDERMQYWINDRKANGQGFLGLDAILKQDIGIRPLHVSRSPRPSGYSKCPALIKENKLAERARREQYSDASMRFRLGDFQVKFPEYSFRPPTHRQPRILPFTPITISDLAA